MSIRVLFSQNDPCGQSLEIIEANSMLEHWDSPVTNDQTVALLSITWEDVLYGVSVSQKERW